MDIYVTGHASISSLGSSRESIMDHFEQHKSGILPSNYNSIDNIHLAKVHLLNSELTKKYHIADNPSRTASLGIAVVSKLLKNHSLPNESSGRIGFISGTSVGGIDATENEYFAYLDKNKFQKQVFKNHSSGTVTEQIANHFPGFCYVNTISTACSSAANAIIQGARLIKHNVLDRVIVGGTDSLSQFTINGFQSLMIYSKSLCKPFDYERSGLNLGEGAGYLILESEKSISKTKSTPIAKLSGWSNTSDAYHQTASSPEGKGAIDSMNEAIQMAKLDPSQIDYINAHGTATPNNDISESWALKTVFKNKIPPFSSTKSFTGHTLAASGGIESSFSILAIQEGLLLPNLNFSEAIPETGLVPNLKFSKNNNIKNVLTNAFGFGGNNSSLIYSSL